MSTRTLMGIIFICFFSISGWAAESSINPVTAANGLTDRIPQFYNEKVNVWRTIIYPGSKEVLPMHRHENDMVIVALTDGTLKQVTDKGVTKNIPFKKNTAYFFTKDAPGTTHSDENIGDKPLELMLIEVK